MSLTLAEFVKSSTHPDLDAEDLAAASRGNRAAFGRLVDRNRNLVSSVALSVVKDVAISEDISQEVFLHAWTGLSQLRSFDSFLPWLRQLTRNKATDSLRARYRRDSLIEPAAPDAVNEQAAPVPTVADALEQREDHARLEAAIDALPESSRETVVLFYREGQSIAQVARLLGLSEEAVKKRLSRAREALRESLLEELSETFEKTAPSDRWTAAVMAALPPLSSVKPMVWATVGKLAWTSLGSALFGPVVGLITILFGHKAEMAEARDEQERQALRQVRNSMLASVLLFTVAIFTAAAFGQRTVAIGVGFVFTAAFTVICLFQLMPIQRKRWAARLAEDPSLAARNRRARLASIGGLCAGAGLSLAALLWLVFGQ